MSVKIDAALVARLIAGQFPQWAELPVTPVVPGGWDNRTFRLGEALSVRLPSAEGYVSQVAKEGRWLPVLAPQLPLPIAQPVALGVPADGYPWPWSVCVWLPGESAETGRIDDLRTFATDLARFLVALQAVPAADGPPPGPHSAWRGGPLSTYDQETRRSTLLLADQLDSGAALAIWDAALKTPWSGPAVWFHGDVSAGNLLLSGGRLSAVIDFGCAGVGDPACDTVIAWTLFAGESRAAFREALGCSAATWARGRGWALWKALITLAEHLKTGSARAQLARHVLDEVMAEHPRA